jgi:hypothetical protein
MFAFPGYGNVRLSDILEVMLMTAYNGVNPDVLHIGIREKTHMGILLTTKAAGEKLYKPKQGVLNAICPVLSIIRKHKPVNQLPLCSTGPRFHNENRDGWQWSVITVSKEKVVKRTTLQALGENNGPKSHKLCEAVIGQNLSALRKNSLPKPVFILD